MVRIAQPRLDTRLARDAEDTRLARSWPCCRRPRAAAESLALFAPAAPVDDATRERLALLRGAIDERRKLSLSHLDLHDQTRERTMRPPACLHWDRVWTLAAWCELRQDFRHFRVDRIQALTLRDLAAPTGASWKSNWQRR